jgi:hypothetical protein
MRKEIDGIEEGRKMRLYTHFSCSLTLKTWPLIHLGLLLTHTPTSTHMDRKAWKPMGLPEKRAVDANHQDILPVSRRMDDVCRALSSGKKRSSDVRDRGDEIVVLKLLDKGP